MPTLTHSLERVYQLVDAKQFQNAELLLGAVVRVEPQNMEAWKIYLRISQTQDDLDWLKERILKTRELNEADKADLINDYLYLTQKINGAKEVSVHAKNTTTLPQEDKKDEAAAIEEANIRFELIDVFDYPTKNVKKDERASPRRRDFYTSIIFDVANGALKSAARHPFGKKVVSYLEKISALTNNITKNPRDAYARFARSPHFEKSIGFSLLGVFALGVRLAISNYFFGYIFLGIFVFAGVWWLVNFGSQNVNALNSQTRVYLHENKNALPAIKDVKTDREIKAEPESPKKSV